MSERHDHPADRLSRLDEAELLAWIEGALPADRASAVEVSLRADPAMHALAQNLRSDREALGSLPAEPAPDGLLDGVHEALEREMLFGLAEDGETSDQLPVSVVRPARSGLWDIFLREQPGRQLAAAAAVLLLAGGAMSYLAVSWLGVLSADVEDGTALAMDTERDESDPATAAEGDHARLEGFAADSIHDQLDLRSRRSGDLSRAASDGVSVSDSGGDSGLGLSSEGQHLLSAPLLAERGRVSPDRAARLLAEGRLIVRVRTLDAPEALASLDGLTGTSHRWRLSPGASETVAAVLAPDGLGGRPAPVVGPTPAFADRQDGAERPSLLRTIPEAEQRQGTARTSFVVERLYTLEVESEARAVQRLVRELSAIGVVDVVLEASPVPLDLPAPSSPESLLWWTEPPSTWTPRGVAPVVVESMR